MPVARTSSRTVAISEIASWALRRPALPGLQPTWWPVLPAIQRGSVWVPQQVENLWDSLLRGFPIGALMVAPYAEGKGRQRYQVESAALGPEPTHHLLDGQQRATSIALGFLDPWDSHSPDQTRAALWLDVAWPEEPDDEREFAVKMVTHAHPWGFDGQDAKRLSIAQTREAIRAFEALTPELSNQKATAFPFARVWPSEAKAPLPLVFLLHAIHSHPEAPREYLKKVMKRLPETEASADHPLARVRAAVEGRDTDLSARLDVILSAVRRLLGIEGEAASAPVLVFEPATMSTRGAHTKDPSAGDDANVRTHPITTLFVRLNTQGTPLDEDELIYATLKSEWPDAARLLEDMHHRIVSPPRFVVLTTRLLLADLQQKTARREVLRPPPAPDLDRFRRLLQGTDHLLADAFRKSLEKAVKRTDPVPTRVFECTWELLAAPKGPLPKMLVAELGRRTPEVLFLVLRWAWRMIRAGHDPLRLTNPRRQRIAGIATAISWFGHVQRQQDVRHCVDAIWNGLQGCNDKDLPGFFCRENLRPLFHLRDTSSPRMLPLPPPDVFDKKMARAIGKLEKRTWSSWKMEHRLYPLSEDSRRQALYAWYKNRFEEIWSADLKGLGHPAAALDERIDGAWEAFLNQLCWRNEIVLFAQRVWFGTWFDDHDPTNPDFVTDRGRPWDWDHIHPQHFVARRQRIPDLVREWHGTIGNLRAWPFDANRALQDELPISRLAKPSDRERTWGLVDRAALLSASFIDEEGAKLWSDACPSDAPPAAYLGNAQYDDQRAALVRVITMRLRCLYREWYETLHIGDWMP